MNTQPKVQDDRPEINDTFDFDLQEMKKAVESGTTVVPEINSVEDLDKWLATV